MFRNFIAIIEASADNSYQALEKHKEAFSFSYKDGGKCKLVNAYFHELDIRGSVHHSMLHKENPTRCNNASKFYFILI
jgi:hypothetical protein